MKAGLLTLKNSKIRGGFKKQIIGRKSKWNKYDVEKCHFDLRPTNCFWKVPLFFDKIRREIECVFSVEGILAPINVIMWKGGFIKKTLCIIMFYNFAFWKMKVQEEKKVQTKRRKESWCLDS